ncbi:DM13 domain-containing protein [Roseivirga sp. E12]|uniref:DM13 domain-containing protein n=1 Tax=Roseivirga sp. E12 TaxID=2819237 RepID=UPI001ABC30E4|nr:DM13 domain-containing protein [Roseivirga sp. E12]MBO3698915.1 DM13 domain-containing protein [Roseivirga sp. E12]
MKRIKTYAILLLAGMGLVSCIGTDVVEDIIVEQTVSISQRLETLAVGDSYQFEANFFDEMGEQSSTEITWTSNNEAVMSITTSGLATGVAEGNVWISAMSGAARDSVMVSVGQNTVLAAAERSGSFVGLRDYNVSGNFTLTEDGDNLVLTFSSNFVASRGPGLFVYLSNNATRVTGGVEMGQLMQNSGAQTYTIALTEAQLDTYNHVLIYCRPFGVAFGTGQFDN